MVRMKLCYIVIGMLLVIGTLHSQEADFIILNGTGSTITDIEIRSKTDKNICSISNIVVEDQKAFPIDLPSQLEKQQDFQVIIKYGKKTAKLKTVHLEQKNSYTIPVYLLTIKGKESSIPLVAGAVVAGATTAGIAATGSAIISGATWATAVFNLTGAGAGALTGTIAWIGSALGGGMAVGIGIIAAVPLAIGASVFSIWYLLKSDTLQMTRIVVQQ